MLYEDNEWVVSENLLCLRVCVVGGRGNAGVPHLQGRNKLVRCHMVIGQTSNENSATSASSVLTKNARYSYHLANGEILGFSGENRNKF